jgi:hypothetical protein
MTAKNFGGWAISLPDERGNIHIVPVNDLKEHLDDECDCHPRQDNEHPELWIHNSFDGREVFERDERKPS